MVLSHLVISNSLQPCGLQSARLLCPQDFPGKNTGVGCHALLQGNLPNPEIELRSPALQSDSLPSEPPGKPIYIYTLSSLSKLIHMRILQIVSQQLKFVVPILRIFYLVLMFGIYIFEVNTYTLIHKAVYIQTILSMMKK